MKFELGDIATPSTLDESWRAVQRGRRSRSRRRRVAGALVLVVVLCAGAMGAWLLRPAPVLAPLNWAQTLAMGALSPGPHRLADGSTVEVDAAARIAVVENSGPALSFRLESGRARFEVTPETGRTWRVFAADSVVEVVGTVFTVDSSGSRLRVEVERGVVNVRGPRVPNGLARLEAGHHLEVVDEVVRAEVPAAPIVVPPRRAPARLPPVIVDAGVAEVVAAPAPPVNVTALLNTANELRASGREDEAMAALEGIVATHADAPEAPLAAFIVARMHQQRGEKALASRWFERALALGLSEPLRSSARQALDGTP